MPGNHEEKAGEGTVNEETVSEQTANETTSGIPPAYSDKPAPDEMVVEIELERLHPFRGHPFKIVEDPEMISLIESIGKYGVLNPLIVRPVPEGWYEIISGHRRKYAAEKLSFRKLPVIIRVMKDEESVIAMVDSNLHRENICPSEKAFAYKMKYDAIKRKSGRRNSSQIDYQTYGKKTVQIMGEEAGESAKQIQRYLKITELIPELLDLLDKGDISFSPAYESAFLKKEEQQNLLRAIQFTKASPSLSQAQRIKQLSKTGKLTYEEMRTILSEVKKGEMKRVMFKNEQLYQFFPRAYTPEQMKQEILRLLEKHAKDRETTSGPGPAIKSGIAAKGTAGTDSALPRPSKKVSYGQNPTGKSFIVRNPKKRSKPN